MIKLDKIHKKTIIFFHSNQTACDFPQVSTSWKILGEGLGIIHSLLSGCVCVEVSPHVLYLQLQIQLGALPGALSQTHR